MTKLWHITVERELEKTYAFHMRKENKPTQAKIIKELSDNHHINDSPDYTNYYVEEVTV